MDLQKIKKINNITKNIEKVYNELQKIKIMHDKKTKQLNDLQKQLNELTKAQ